MEDFIGHGIRCSCGGDHEDPHPCFWEYFEIFLRGITKRESYIDNSCLDAGDGNDYIHEIAECNGSGIEKNPNV
jgi:hypothetical protein